MKIKINSGKMRLRLWLPLAFLKSRFAYKLISGGYSNSVPTSMPPSAEPVDLQKGIDDVSANVSPANPPAGEVNLVQSKEFAIKISRFEYAQMKVLYKILKDYVRKNGHCTVFDVEAQDSDGKVNVSISI